MMNARTARSRSSRRLRALLVGATGLSLTALPFACTDDETGAPDSGVDASGFDAVADVRSETSIGQDTSTTTDANLPADAGPETAADASGDATADATDAGDGASADASTLARIVYVSGSNIWVMDPDGSNKTNLTNTLSTNYGNPAWSPDRSKIAFNSDKDDGSGEIYVMNADGSNMVRLTNFVGESDVEPAWSPDGNKLAFASRRDHFISSIYVMDSETGADVIRVTNGGTGSDQGPSWSSGNRIAFWTNEGSIGLHIGIVDVNPSVPFDAGEAGAGVWGTNRTGLLSNLAYGLNPSWSPDGTKLVYSAGTGTRHIGVMNPDGTGQVDLTGGSNEDHPSFSPDGTRITFDRNVSGKVLVHTMNVNGSNQTVLTESDAGPGGTNPGW